MILHLPLSFPKTAVISPSVGEECPPHNWFQSTVALATLSQKYLATRVTGDGKK
jgi:hypothetical protein